MNALKEASPAYSAYLKLVMPPKNVPPYPRGPAGEPIMERGEVFCRMTGFGRPVCGSKHKDDKELQSHIFQRHYDECQLRLSNFKRCTNANEIDRLKDFYTELMKYEEYPGKPAVEEEDDGDDDDDEVTQGRKRKTTDEPPSAKRQRNETNENRLESELLSLRTKLERIERELQQIRVDEADIQRQLTLLRRA